MRILVKKVIGKPNWTVVAHYHPTARGKCRARVRDARGVVRATGYGSTLLVAMRRAMQNAQKNCRKPG